MRFLSLAGFQKGRVWVSRVVFLSLAGCDKAGYVFIGGREARFGMVGYGVAGVRFLGLVGCGFTECGVAGLCVAGGRVARVEFVSLAGFHKAGCVVARVVMVRVELQGWCSKAWQGVARQGWWGVA